MKKNLFIFALFIVGMYNSQDFSDKKNIVKTNVTGYAFRNVNLSYERAIKKWLSINVGFGTMPDGNVPFLNSFVKDGETEFSNVKVSLTNFTIEPRFYLGQGYGKGFYIAPYFRHTNFKGNNFIYNYEHQDALGNTEEIPVTINGKTNGNSGGLMVGVQWFLGKKDNWVLDWWIVGAHYGSGKGDFNGTSNRALNQVEQQELKKQLEDLDIPMVKYTVETNDHGARIKMDGPWAGLRSGVSLGYRF